MELEKRLYTIEGMSHIIKLDENYGIAFCIDEKTRPMHLKFDDNGNLTKQMRQECDKNYKNSLL